MLQMSSPPGVEYGGVGTKMSILAQLVWIIGPFHPFWTIFDAILAPSGQQFWVTNFWIGLKLLKITLARWKMCNSNQKMII